MYTMGQFQSTLPRGERHRQSLLLRSFLWISIHAPAWGATVHSMTFCVIIAAFQSTLPRGERRKQHASRTRSIGISIHAPAWGATHKAWIIGEDYGNFNPRSRVGSDCRTHAGRRAGNNDFNPRSRVGSDACRARNSCQGTYFNPRSRVGSDCQTRRNACIYTISIHAPAWGATFVFRT